VLVSDDDGHAWRQMPSPVSVTLTAVRFFDASNGIAIGHGGTVLITNDGGESWTRRLDGRRIAQLALQAAHASGRADALKEAQRLAADGPDKPLLDVLLFDSRRALVVGAYGMALATEDGGAAWTPWMNRLDNPKGLHCYAVRRRGEALVIAGEQGLLLRSDDDGRTFRRLSTPYRGSFFTVELPADHEIVVAGLRGNTWRSVDDGRTWSQVASPTGATITASLVLPRGDLLLTDQAGFILRLDGNQLVPINKTPFAALSGVARANDGHLVALTVQGVVLLNAHGTEETAS
jgi:photosystem II stability/assembly factor-like uncharacterized protein